MYRLMNLEKELLGCVMNIQNPVDDQYSCLVIEIDKGDLSQLVKAFEFAATQGYDQVIQQISKELAAVDPYYKQAGIMKPYQGESIAVDVLSCTPDDDDFNNKRRQGKSARLEEACRTLEAADIAFDREALQRFEQNLQGYNFHGSRYRVAFNIPAQSEENVRSVIHNAGIAAPLIEPA